MDHLLSKEMGLGNHDAFLPREKLLSEVSRSSNALEKLKS